MEIKRTLILLNKIDVQELVDENLVMADSIMMIRAVVYGVLIATTNNMLPILLAILAPMTHCYF
jgi:hypothetical protein